MPRLPKTYCITAFLAAALWVASVQADEGGVRVAAPLKVIGHRRDIKTADQVPARIAFAQSGRQIGIARKSGGGVQVWNIESGEERLSLAGDAILAFGWSDDGKTIAGIGKDRRYTAWSAVASTDGQVKPGDVLVSRRIGEPSSLRPPALTASLDRVAVAADTQVVALYGADGVLQSTFLPPPGRAACELAISADGQWIAAELRRRDDGADAAQTRIGLWNTKKSGRPEPPLLPCEAIRHCNDMRHLQFSPDGATLALQEGSYCELWDVASRHSIGNLRLKGDWLAFSPDGRWLMNLDEDGFSVVEVATAQIAYQVGSGPKDPMTTGFVRWHYDTHDVHPRFSAIAVSPSGKHLATATSAREPVWLWDLRPPKTWPPADVVQREELWRDLIEGDAVRGYRAVWRLIAGEDDTTRFLAAKLTPAKKPEDLPRRIANLVTDLDHRKFAVREAATKSLAALGPEADAHLQKVLAAAPSPEVKARITAILKSRSPATGRLSGDKLRRHRTVQVLEHIGTTEAKKLLANITNEHAPEAKAALARLEALRRAQ